jgi:hypothetical protein
VHETNLWWQLSAACSKACLGRNHESLVKFTFSGPLYPGKEGIHKRRGKYQSAGMLQSTDHLAQGPLPHAPSCIRALEDILRSQYLAQQCSPPFVAAWQAVKALSEAGEDRGALLRHITASGTLPAALRSPLWQTETSVRSFHFPYVCRIRNAWLLCIQNAATSPSFPVFPSFSHSL